MTSRSFPALTKTEVGPEIGSGRFCEIPSVGPTHRKSRQNIARVFMRPFLSKSNRHQQPQPKSPCAANPREKPEAQFQATPLRQSGRQRHCCPFHLFGSMAWWREPLTGISRRGTNNYEECAM